MFSEKISNLSREIKALCWHAPKELWLCGRLAKRYGMDSLSFQFKIAKTFWENRKLVEKKPSAWQSRIFGVSLYLFPKSTKGFLDMGLESDGTGSKYLEERALLGWSLMPTEVRSFLFAMRQKTVLSQTFFSGLESQCSGDEDRKLVADCRQDYDSKEISDGFFNYDIMRSFISDFRATTYINALEENNPSLANILEGKWIPSNRPSTGILHEAGHGLFLGIQRRSHDISRSNFEHRKLYVMSNRSFVRAYRKDIENMGGVAEAQKRFPYYVNTESLIIGDCCFNKGRAEAQAECWATNFCHIPEQKTFMSDFANTREWLLNYTKHFCQEYRKGIDEGFKFALTYYNPSKYDNQQKEYPLAAAHARIVRGEDEVQDDKIKKEPAHAMIKRHNRGYFMPNGY